MTYRGADKSLARLGRKQARNIPGTHAISTTSRRELSSSFFSLQGKAPKEIHAILTETLACFLPGRAMDLSAPPVVSCCLRVTGYAHINHLLSQLLLSNHCEGAVNYVLSFFDYFSFNNDYNAVRIFL